MELKMQAFAFEDSEAFSLTIVSSKLPQSPLSRSVTEQLKLEFRDKVLLDKLRTCVKTTIGLLSRILVRSLDADCTIPLAVYWKDILAHDEELPSATTRQHIKLMHLEALWNLMESSAQDDFQSILDKYKEEISDPMLRDDVKFFAHTIDSSDKVREFLSVLKSYIFTWLTQDDRKHSDVLKIWLGAATISNGDTLAECPWYEENFPETVVHSFAVDTYIILKDTLKAIMDERVSEGAPSEDISML